MILLTVLTPVAAHAQSVIEGPATVIDGDGLMIGDTEIRLCGIDAPEIVVGRASFFGRVAKSHLEKLVAGKTIVCKPVGTGTPCDGTPPRSRNRTNAQCFDGDTDLAMQMVKDGMATDWEKFSGGHYKRD